MNICIIGWYGTETMGDRAILDGILTVFNAFDQQLTIQIGSLYPFYTNRTLYEERQVYGKLGIDADRISIFNVKNKYSVDECIKKSELLVFGGGPLMDLKELFIMRYCFKTAHMMGIPSIVMGCGVGPLEQKQSILLVNEIFQYATAVALRDQYSYNRVLELDMMEDKISWIGDPAVISVEAYKKNFDEKKEKNNMVAVNFREFPEIEYGKNSFFNWTEGFEVVRYLSKVFDEMILVPMHTFDIGGDDRNFYAKMFISKKLDNVKVLFRPLNLYELYKIYSSATACIGMRYHSILMQTILNGNNFVFNYTHNAGRKIDGFIDSINGMKFYSNRIWYMDENIVKDRLLILQKNIRFEYSFSKMESEYIKLLENVLE